jgi:hypothetical protein
MGLFRSALRRHCAPCGPAVPPAFCSPVARCTLRYGREREDQSQSQACVGEPVPLSATNVDATVMIVAPGKDGRNIPVGTGFVVATQGPTSAKGFGYVVTAAHVVRFATSSYVRLSLRGGQVSDWSVPEWTFHDDGETDIAVAPISLDQRKVRHRPTHIEPDIDENRPLPRLGEVVYFVGLLANIESMHPENVPMVRSGTLGRLYQEGVEIKWPDQTVHSMTAHLIDCRSHSGFSGSPCYVQLEPRGRTDLRGWDTYLLGLITGHLDEIGVDQRVNNTGIGLVTPVEDIWHVLMQEELVEHREQQIARYQLSLSEPLMTAELRRISNRRDSATDS